MPAISQAAMRMPSVANEREKIEQMIAMSGLRQPSPMSQCRPQNNNTTDLDEDTR